MRAVETLTMRCKERDRIAIMVVIQQGELKLRAAAQVWGPSDRQTRRVQRCDQAGRRCEAGASGTGSARFGAQAARPARPDCGPVSGAVWTL